MKAQLGTNAEFDRILERCEQDLSEIANSSVLITGASGMLARYLIELLMSSNEKKGTNIRVIALARDFSKAEKTFRRYLKSDLFHLLIQDVCDPIHYDAPVDYIVHAASNASPKWIKSDPVGIIKANTLGTMSVCEFATKCQNARLLLTSTREVYGEVHGVESIVEEQIGALDPLNARSCYPESKRMAEQICRSYERQYGLDFVIARIAHAYGPGMNIVEDGRVMSDFISDAINHRDITLNSDGGAIRAFCYIEDAVAAILRVIVKGCEGQAYNIANETEEISVIDLANRIATMVSPNLRVMIRRQKNDGSYCEYKRVSLNCSRLESLGWAPQVSLDEGLNLTLRSFGVVYD